MAGKEQMFKRLLNVPEGRETQLRRKALSMLDEGKLLKSSTRIILHLKLNFNLIIVGYNLRVI